MPEYAIPDGQERYRIVLDEDFGGRPNYKDRPAAYHLYYHTDRYYNTIGGVKQIVNKAKRYPDFFQTKWHIEKGVVQWTWNEVDIYASSSP